VSVGQCTTLPPHHLHMTLFERSRGLWELKTRKCTRAKDMPAECRDMSACDWVTIASPPHGLSIVVAFPTGWVNTGGPGGSFPG
jgi:hypothetical protein